MEWYMTEKETILLYGGAKCGKTWAYCSIIERYIQNPETKVYIINTDKGVSKTLKQYFNEDSAKITERIVYEFATSIQEVISFVDEIKKVVKGNDLIIIDLISDFWEMAQNSFMEEASGGNVVGWIEKMSKDMKSFGLFDGMKWQYIKKLDGYVIDKLITKAPCDVIGISSQKDLDVEKVMNKGKIKSAEYESAGAKPAGQPTLGHRFNTIVYIGKTEKGEKHYFQIMGDRGAVTNQGMISFDKNFWEVFVNERKKRY